MNIVFYKKFKMKISIHILAVYLKKKVLKRHIGFYVLQVYVPCVMLTILSWVSFFINREATSDRSCIGKLRKSNSSKIND
jgi:hypothetical protein